MTLQQAFYTSPGFFRNGIENENCLPSAARRNARATAKNLCRGSFFAALFFCLTEAAPGAEPSQSRSPASYQRWTNGPSSDPSYFPIAVWLQSPQNASRYKAAGINLYLGLWRGPTGAQLTSLQQAGMSLICSQNQAALQHKDNPLIVGWMHGDEPDNAQSLGQGKGYGPPILPESIQRDYQRLSAVDPSRPVLLNLGQGVAWDNYIGRGVRRGHPEDYPEYVKGCDIASFDIYPAVHESKEVVGKLEYVAQGVERLAGWAGGAKPVWNCIECTHIGNSQTKPSPAQVRTEVWMSLIHGSRGLIYFVHQFKPAFREAALLDDPEMLAAVTTLNRQIHDLAPVLNSRSVTNEVSVVSSSPETPIAWMLKKHGNATYLFTVAMRNSATRGSFKFSGLPEPTQAEVLGESRAIPVRNGEFVDEFRPYEVHLYRLGRS